MNLRDAMERVEREQPHLTGTAKIQAIKDMRSQPKPEPQEPAPEPAEAEDEKPARKPTSVGEAWGFLVFVIIVMQLIPWVAWGSLTAEPHWYDALHAVLLVGATVELVSAYRRRSS